MQELTQFKLKTIQFKSDKLKIVLQNQSNSALIAIFNIMILQGRIKVQSNDEFISLQVIYQTLQDEFNLVQQERKDSDQNLEIEQIFHKLNQILEVNQKFSGIEDFEISSEVDTIRQLKIRLVHGWIINPSDKAYDLIYQLSHNQLKAILAEKQEHNLQSEEQNRKLENYSIIQN